MSIAYGENNDFNSIIERLKNGDKSAFSEIYKRCSTSIAFLCQKFCDSKEDAEEVVQDTFVIAYKKAADLRGDTLTAYLRKIAIYECFRKRNKNSHRYEYTMHSDNPAEECPELNESFLPEEALQSKERQNELLRIISQLPKKRREMIYLYYYADLSTEEIAHLMDCTVNNVHQTLFAARGTIKSKLAGEDKKTDVKAVVFLPLSALFFVEEQAFAADYIPAAAPNIGGADIAGEVVSTMTISTKGYVIAACIAAVCTVSAVTYFALQPSAVDYDHEPYESAYEIYIPAAEETVDGVVEDIVAEELEQVRELEEISEQEYVEEPASSAITSSEQIEDFEPLPGSIEEPEVREVLEPVPVAEPEPEPIHVDRTPEILAALAAANTAGDVTSIINRYDFRFVTSMRNTADMLLRFYVLNEGSGDILIGTAIHEDGSQWRMRFTHFAGGQMSTDIVDLLRFMEPAMKKISLQMQGLT